MAGSFLRLDLDSSGILAQVVEQNNRQTLIRDHCHVMFKDLPVLEENKEFFDAGMDRVAQQLDLKPCSNAIVYVPPFSVSFRNMDLPFGSEKKIAQILPFELETVLPYGNRAVVSDFHKLDLEDNANLILTASVLESDVETYFSTLGRLGIKPGIITHKGYAASVSFLKDRTDVSDCIFIHITAQAITLVLIKNKKPCMVRVFAAASHIPETLVVSINQTIIGFEQRTGCVSAVDVFISCEADGIDIHPIYDALEKTLRSPPGLRSTELSAQNALVRENIDGISLLSGVVPDKRINYLFNFCKGKYGATSFFNTHFKSLASCIVLVLCVFILSIINIHSDISTLETQIAILDHKAVSIFKSTFPETKNIQDPYLQMKANVQDLIKKSGGTEDKDQTIKNKDASVVDILGELSGKIDTSTDMEISRFLYTAGRIILTGSTDNFNTVDTIKSKIESSDLFKTVSISSAAVDKKGDRVNFKFIIEM